MSRVPHASGLLDGTYPSDTVFPPDDHRAHRRREWLEAGVKKLAAIEVLRESMTSTMGQVAIKFVLSEPNVASVLPNILSIEQLEEFAAAPETDDIPTNLVEELHEAFDNDFGLGVEAQDQQDAGAALSQ